MIHCKSDWAKIAAACVLPNLGGFYGSRHVAKNIDGWYKELKFPSYKPPNWVFAPVWTSLYCGMGYASYLVWKDGGGFSGDAKLPLALYGTQLALNWAWTPIFFGKHDIKMGLAEILALTTAAGLTGITFYRVNETAGLIFIPYMAWLCFASMLNYAIFKLNPDNKPLSCKKIKSAE